MSSSCSSAGDYLDQLAKTHTPKLQDQHESIELREAIIQKVMKKTKALGYFLIGSYARGTSLSVMSDTDMLLFLPADTQLHMPTYLRAVEEVVQDMNLQHRFHCRLQNHSIGMDEKEKDVTGSQHGVEFDLVFAKMSGYDYKLFDETLTNPQKVKAALLKVQTDCGYDLHLLIRLMKLWNCRQGKPLKGLHVELLMYRFRMLASFGRRLDQVLYYCFSHLHTQVTQVNQGRCSVPGSEVGITIEDEKYSTIVTKLEQAVQLANQACNSSTQQEAISCWKQIFCE